ncbi:MAG: hypothetical protein WC592_00315 [Candidatus Omnitrophota bacterium]
MAIKDIRDFTLEEIVNKATKGMVPQDTDKSVSMISSADVLKIVADFKIAQKQDELNTKLIRLTKWLVILTITLVILTIILTYKTVNP